MKHLTCTQQEKAAEAPLDAVVNKMKHGVEVAADKLNVRSIPSFITPPRG